MPLAAVVVDMSGVPQRKAAAGSGVVPPDIPYCEQQSREIGPL